MAAQTYASIKDTVAVALTQQANDMDLTVTNALFEAQFPQALSYAENLIYRRLTMLAARETNTSLSTAAGIRSLDLSTMSPQVVVPEGFGLASPAGTIVPFDVTSLDVIDLVWPTVADVLDPADADPAIRLWAMLDDHTLVYCPTADGTYTASVTGLFQPATLSESNTSTYLSVQYPELLEAGCLVFLTGALTRNFGAQSSEPAQANSWQRVFDDLLQAADDEERRRRGLAPNVPQGKRSPQEDASPTSPA